MDFLLVLIELFLLRVTTEALWAKIDRKSAICKQVGHHSHRRGRPPPIIFCTDSWANACLTTLSLTVFTQRNFVLSSSEVQFYTENGPLGAYGNVWWSSEKCAVHFLVVLIELFLLGVTGEALRVSIGSKSAIALQRGLVDPKFQVVAGTPHQPFFFSEN